jgi:ABC-type branched-subunit amino acid transport system ATPase component
LVVGELLVLDGVCKGFWRGQSWLGVLKDVSLEVERGQVVGVISQRLGGKTTLLEVAAGMETPDAGSVTLAGRSFEGASPPGWRGWLSARRERAAAPKLGRDVVWVTRGGPHQELEVSKYVGWPLAVHGRSDVRMLAAAALERVGAQDCISRQWGELSNWQRLLVGLARGFAGAPQLVVIDDLLDGHTSQDTDVASDLLHSLVEESEPRCGVLLSTGYFDSAVVLAHEVWELSRGKLTSASGPPDEDEDHDEDPNDVIVPFRQAEKRGSRGIGPA